MPLTNDQKRALNAIFDVIRERSSFYVPDINLGDILGDLEGPIPDAKMPDPYTPVDGTWNVTGAVYVSGGTQITGGAEFIPGTGGVFVNGNADINQLVVQGHSTQTTRPFVVENSAGVDQFTVSNTGEVSATTVVLGNHLVSNVWRSNDSATPQILSASQNTLAQFINVSETGVLKLTGNQIRTNADGDSFTISDGTNTLFELQDTGTGGAAKVPIILLGSSPSATGALRMQNNEWIAARNAANTADVNIIRASASDRLQLGAPLEGTKYKTADEAVTSSTVLQDDDHLSVSLEANATYWFKFFIFHQNAGATEGIKFALNGTVGVTSLKGQIRIGAGASTADARVTAFESAVGATLAATDNYSEVTGTIETSTAGTFLLRWAQNTSGAGATTVQRNSSLVMLRVN